MMLSRLRPVPRCDSACDLITSTAVPADGMVRKAEFRKMSNEQLTGFVLTEREQGLSWGAIARRMGVSSGMVSKWARGDYGLYTKAGAPSSSGDTYRRSVSDVVDVKELEERIRLRDTVGSLRSQMDTVTVQLDKITSRLESMDRKPLHVESHDGRADVSCPTCGTHAILDTRRPAEQFDEVLAEFDLPHKESPTGKAVDCPTCRPKIDAKLKEYGYVLSKAPSARR